MLNIKSRGEVEKRTVWSAVVEAIRDACRVFLVLCLELVFACFPVASREYIRYKLVVLPEL